MARMNRGFSVIIPARLGSTRLPGKPLADLAGKPMVVRVAEQARLSGADLVVVACDHPHILEACQQHGVMAYLTRDDHLSGTDRIAEVAELLGLADDAVIVNVQGDEPLIDPALIAATAAKITAGVEMATAAHPILSPQEAFNPNVVKVVLDKAGRAMYFSRATIPWYRDAFSDQNGAAGGKAGIIATGVLPDRYTVFRHIGLYAYTHAFLRLYPTLEAPPLEQIEALEQLRVLWNGYPIAVHVTTTVPLAGVDTPEDLERVRLYYVQSGA